MDLYCDSLLFILSMKYGMLSMIREKHDVWKCMWVGPLSLPMGIGEDGCFSRL